MAFTKRGEHYHFHFSKQERSEKQWCIGGGGMLQKISKTLNLNLNGTAIAQYGHFQKFLERGWEFAQSILHVHALILCSNPCWISIQCGSSWDWLAVVSHSWLGVVCPAL